MSRGTYCSSFGFLSHGESRCWGKDDEVIAAGVEGCNMAYLGLGKRCLCLVQETDLLMSEAERRQMWSVEGQY